MRIFVDGMNVIGARADGWWRDRAGAMARLVEELDALAAGDEHRWTVVFDGRPRRLAATPQYAAVEWSRRSGRNAADDRIVELVQAAGPGCLVYTSDRELRARAIALGAQVEGASALRRQLDALVRRGPRG